MFLSSWHTILAINFSWDYGRNLILSDLPNIPRLILLHYVPTYLKIVIRTYYITFQDINLQPYFKIARLKSVLWPVWNSNVVDVSLSGGSLGYWTACNNFKRHCTLPYCESYPGKMLPLYWDARLVAFTLNVQLTPLASLKQPKTSHGSPETYTVPLPTRRITKPCRNIICCTVPAMMCDGRD